MIERLVDELQQNKSVSFYVRARPGASNTEAVGVMDDESVKIDIAAPAEGGKANVVLIKYIANQFEVDESQVKIVSGQTSRHKLVRITM